MFMTTTMVTVGLGPILVMAGFNQLVQPNACWAASHPEVANFLAISGALLGFRTLIWATTVSGICATE